jgi:hypothetical protein
MSSPLSVERIAAPSTRPVWASTMIFIRPAVSSRSMARAKQVPQNADDDGRSQTDDGFLALQGKLS